MAIVNMAEFMESLKNVVGENTSDEALQLLENASDTMKDYEDRLKDQTDWKAKFEENDKTWRTKYQERFFNTDVKDEEDDTEPDDTGQHEAPKSFDDLFKPL